MSCAFISIQSMFVKLFKGDALRAADDQLSDKTETSGSQPLLYALFAESKKMPRHFGGPNCAAANEIDSCGAIGTKAGFFSSDKMARIFSA